MCLLGEQGQDEELKRYKALVDSVSDRVEDIACDSKTTDQRVSVLGGRDDERVLKSTYKGTLPALDLRVSWLLRCRAFRTFMIHSNALYVASRDTSSPLW